MKEKIRYLFRFSGRVARLQYFFGAIVLPIILSAIILFFGAFVGEGVNQIEQPNVAFLAAILFLIVLLLLVISCVFIPIAFQVRRLHDLNHTGWWIFAIWGLNLLVGYLLGAEATQGQLIMASIICLLPGLYLLFWKGTSGPNEYGSDPLQMMQ